MRLTYSGPADIAVRIIGFDLNFKMHDRYKRKVRLMREDARFRK